MYQVWCCYYLGWSGSILQFRQNIKKVGLKSWLLTCSSIITLSLPSYTGSALKRELYFRNDYINLPYFWSIATFDNIGFYKLVHCAVHRHCGSFDTGTTPKNGIPLTNSNIISQKNILFLCGIVTVMLLLVEHY